MNEVKHPALQAFVFVFCVLAVAGVCIVVSAPWPFNPVSAAPELVGPVLSIPAQIPADPGDVVVVPVNFAANGTSIASVVFSIDFDETRLSLATSEPFSITVNLPTGFQGGCTPDLGDTDGEIDCTIFDQQLPFQSLPANIELVTIKLRAGSPPATVDARVGFSSNPPASFGNTSGYSEPGSVVEGSIRIIVPTVTTNTPTPTSTQTATPTPTQTATPTPTGTVVTSPIPRSFAPIVLNQTGQMCQNLLLNSGFEDNTAWELPSTEYPAAYTTALAHTGARSMRTGIVNAADNRPSYSSARQQVTIPTSFDWVRLYFWRYAVSGEVYNNADSPARALPARPVFGLPFGDSPLSGNDVQYVLILDTNNNLRETLVWMLVNQPVWIYQEFLLNNYAGQTIKVQFGVYNDGYSGISAMYVDDAVIEVCQ